MPPVRAVVLSLAAALGVAATASLGFWQWGRGQQRTALGQAIEQKRNLPPLDAAALLGFSERAPLIHQPVRLRGEWIADRTVFLDNRQMAGRQGFYVVTPLRLEGRPEAILVQRGWAPRDFAKRDALPVIPTPGGSVEVLGRLAPPPAKLYAFERKETGPIRQNLDLAAFRAETGLPLLEVSVQQTGESSDGLDRRWPQPASGAEKNFGYAFQWWALSALIAALYVWFQFIQPRRAARAR